MKLALSLAVVCALPSVARASNPALGLEVEFQGSKVVLATGDPLTAANTLSYSYVAARSARRARDTGFFHPGEGTYEYTIQLTLDGCAAEKDICDMEVVTGPAEGVHWDDMREALKCYERTTRKDWSAVATKKIRRANHSSFAPDYDFLPLATFLDEYNRCVGDVLRDNARTWTLGRPLAEGLYVAISPDDRGIAPHVNFGIPLEMIGKKRFLDAFGTQIEDKHTKQVTEVRATWAASQLAAAELMELLQKHYPGIRKLKAWKLASLQGLVTVWFVWNTTQFAEKDDHVNLIRQTPDTIAKDLAKLWPELIELLNEEDDGSSWVMAVYKKHFPKQWKALEDEERDAAETESKEKTGMEVGTKKIPRSWLFVMSGKSPQYVWTVRTTKKQLKTTESFYDTWYMQGWPGVVFESRLGDLHYAFGPLDSVDGLYGDMKSLLQALTARENLTGA